MRLIDADALLNGREFIIIGAGDNVCIDIADIENAPTIEAEPVKHGRWIAYYFDESPVDVSLKCSSCGVLLLSEELPCRNYCPSCGAKMDAEDEA